MGISKIGERNLGNVMDGDNPELPKRNAVYGLFYFLRVSLRLCKGGQYLAVAEMEIT